MAQASSQWQQLVNQIAELFNPEFSQEVLQQLSRLRSRKQTGSLVLLGIAVALLIWNWQLLLATGTGISVMLAMYWMQQWDWQQMLQQWRQLFVGTNRSIAIAVLSGGIASLLTYIAVSIWIASDNHWIATGEILQSIGIFAILCLTIRQAIPRQSSQEQMNLNQLIVNLTDADPLKRLISVRQLTSVLRNHHGDSTQQRAIADYFNLMWSRETEPLVREALLEGLGLFGETKQLAQGRSPLSIPFTAKPVSDKVPYQIYE